MINPDFRSLHDSVLQNILSRTLRHTGAKFILTPCSVTRLFTAIAHGFMEKAHERVDDILIPTVFLLV